jgi:hypothetical protein
VFRAGRDGFHRESSQGWSEALLTRIASDDIVARSVLAGEALAQLRTLCWEPGALPAPPDEPVVALGIMRRGTLSAIVLYGRHANGTELEPEELQLLRRLGDAAAVAYETVDVFALCERNAASERRVLTLETGAAIASNA